MLNSELAPLIDQTTKAIGDFLKWYNLVNHLTQFQLCEQGSPAEADQLRKMDDDHERKNDAKVAVRQSVPLLAAEMERRGEDSSALLKMLHCIDGGGGPTNAYPLWPDVKVQLQRIAIRLRSVQITPAEPSEGEQTLERMEITEESRSSPPEYEFARRGGMFSIRGFGESGFIPANLLGVQQIAMILKTPGMGVQMDKLVAISPNVDNRVKAANRRTEQPVNDAQAIREYRQELSNLRQRKEAAESNGQLAKAEGFAREIETLSTFIAVSQTRKGSSKDLNSLTDRLRPRINGTLKTAYTRMRDAGMPKLADHFEQTIASESACFIYRISANNCINWHLEDQI